MDAYGSREDNDPEPEEHGRSLEPSDARLGDLPLREADHGEILRMIIGEGVEATMETFFEAKDPDIDPMLKLKLIGLASSVGDNVRKAIATYATHCRSQG